MWAYLDTSALVKRYIDEAGRRAVLRLLRRHDCVTSVLPPVELRSALRRRVSEGTLDAARVPKPLSASPRIGRTGRWLKSAGSLAAAETLVLTQPLRTLDAIHIASAQLFADRVTASNLVFVSADVRQTAAAAMAGLAVRHIGS